MCPWRVRYRVRDVRAIDNTYFYFAPLRARTTCNERAQSARYARRYSCTLYAHNSKSAPMRVCVIVNATASHAYERNRTTRSMYRSALQGHLGFSAIRRSSDHAPPPPNVRDRVQTLTSARAQHTLRRPPSPSSLESPQAPTRPSSMTTPTQTLRKMIAGRANCRRAGQPEH